MYDNVGFWIERGTTAGDIASVPLFLDDVKEIYDKKINLVKTYGSINGLLVSISPYGLSLTGSLSRALYENNIYTLDRHSTTEAISKISDALRLDFRLAKVTSLEFGQQFPMRFPVTSYFSRLGEAPYMLRNELKHGSLYYKTRGRNPSRILIFYDKKAEMLEKHKSIPTILNTVHLLKYEIRLKRPCLRKFGDITGETLSDRQFYEHLKQDYIRSYFNIEKIKHIDIYKMNNIKTVNDAFTMIVGRYLNQVGQQQIMADIETMKSENLFMNRNNYYRLKKKILEVIKMAEQQETDTLLSELDDSIRNVMIY